MTTWHEDENLREVLFTLLMCSEFDDWEPERFVIVFLGKNSSAKTEVLKAIDAELHDKLSYEAKRLVKKARRDIDECARSNPRVQQNGDKPPSADP